MINLLMVCGIDKTGDTSKVDDYNVPTLKTKLITALTKMELLKRKVSWGEDNGAYLMFTE